MSHIDINHERQPHPPERLVGAVTHVLVNNPTEGYGILAETMLAQTPQTLEAKVS